VSDIVTSAEESLCSPLPNDGAISERTAPVSAVIAAYNSSSFIGEAIQSIYNQTLPVAELIVVVDDSTDGTEKIAASMGARVVSNGTAGLAAARNRCIRESSQPWIAFLDSDDTWEPKKIESQMDLVADHPEVAIVTCDYLTYSGSSVVFASALEKYESGYRSQPKQSVSHGKVIKFLDSEFPDAYYFLLASNVMLRRDVLETTGLFDESLYSADDFDCFMRMLANHSLAIAESVLVRRRMHQYNTSAHHPRAALSCLSATIKVLEKPELYPAATVKLCREWLPANLRHAGARLLLGGETRKARELLLRSVRLELNPRTVMALAASITPSRIGRNLMSLRYYVSRKFGI
jgi:glycosyltransferase involved in cell wall biosynthesis